MTPLVSHILVALCSFMLGSGVGWLARIAVSKREKVEVASSKWNLGIGVGVIILTIVSLIGVMIGIQDYAKATQCQADYNKEENRNTQILAESTIKMLDSITDQSTTPADRLEAVNSWKEDYKRYLNFLTNASTRQCNED